VLAGATISAGCVGACAFAYPFLDSLNGTRNVIFAGADTVELDLAPIQSGQQTVVAWRGWPIFVQRRTPAMLAALRDPALHARLRDPESEVLQQPDDARNWHRSVLPEIGVYIGICTHLGCVPRYGAPVPTDAAGHYACPCHGSKFDAAGRAFRDAPAPYNLPVPPVTVLSARHLRIGVSTGDPKFDIDAIRQL